MAENWRCCAGACHRRALRCSKRRRPAPASLEAKGKSVDFKELLREGPDKGTTNIRRLDKKHWARWLGLEHRCIVPLTSFSEFNRDVSLERLVRSGRKPPLACFAGLWTNWTSVRKIKEGETTNDLFGFLLDGHQCRGL